MSQHTIFFGDQATFVYDDQSRTFTPLVVEWVSPTPTLDKMEAEPCPRGDDKYEETCTNRHQCWEPCGELGHSEEHARPVVIERIEPIDGPFFVPFSVRIGATEKKREPLDWNKPASTDRFPGFTVSSHTQDQQASQNHALQRCADFDGLVMKF